MAGVRAATAAAAAPLVVGCSTSDSGTPTPTPFGVPSTTPPTPAAVTLTPAEVELYGPRIELPGGLLKKQLGKVAQSGGPDDTDQQHVGVRMIVDSIQVDPKCDPYTPKPERGHRLVLALRAETSPSYDPVRDPIPQYFAWSTIAVRRG